MKVSIFLFGVYFGGDMNNFYGILKIEKISEVIFDYHNKNKLYFYITCIDIDSKKYNSKLILKCNETLIDKIYSKLKNGYNVFVLGKVESNKKYNIDVKHLELVL